MSEPPAWNEHALVTACDYDTRLAVTAYTFRAIVQHATEGGTYRTLVYGRLGFNYDAYSVLLDAGGLEISNEFNRENANAIATAAKALIIRSDPNLQEVVTLKDALDLCNEPGCLEPAQRSLHTPDGFRRTCRAHPAV